MSDALQSHDCKVHGICKFHGYSPWNSLGKNPGVGYFLLQGIFPTQGSNPGLPYCRQILYQLSHKGSPSGGLVVVVLPANARNVAWLDPWLEKIRWRREWQPINYSCLETSMDRGAWCSPCTAESGRPSNRWRNPAVALPFPLTEFSLLEPLAVCNPPAPPSLGKNS